MTHAVSNLVKAAMRMRDAASFTITEDLRGCGCACDDCGICELQDATKALENAIDLFTATTESAKLEELEELPSRPRADGQRLGGMMQIDLDAEVRCEREGALACREGVCITKNPYDASTLESEYWRDGHDRCRTRGWRSR